MKQLIIDTLIKIKRDSFFNKIIFKILVMLKGALGKNDADLIRYNLNGRDILIPFSHDLPVNRALLPLYSENIGRISSYLLKKYPELKILDIGANIGDTVYIIKSHADVPILCIEGDAKYFSLAKKNTRYWNDVYLENSFIGDTNFENAEYVYHKGSGRIVKGEKTNSTISFANLTSVLERHKLFSDFKLLKIDTDGYDCKIIRSEESLLRRLKPVIFFEYDPDLLGNIGDDGLSVFAMLKAIGYKDLIFYENTGDYLLTSDISQANLIEDIHQFYSGRKSARFCDVCAFHADDADLVSEIRLQELKASFRKS